MGKAIPKANPAWTQEVERLVREARKARRKATLLGPWDGADYKRVMKQKKQALRRGRTYVWRSFMAEITKGKGIWKMVKWAKTKADKPQTTPQCPPLQKSAQESLPFDRQHENKDTCRQVLPTPRGSRYSRHTCYSIPRAYPHQTGDHHGNDCLAL